MKTPFVLFDFDGVVVESFNPAFEVAKMKCPHVTTDDYRRRFEGNINEWDRATEQHTDECRQDIDFFTEYLPRMKEQAYIIPGMKEVIIELEKKYTLVVISSTITSPIEEFLKSHDLASHFDWIMGNDVHKSKIEKMKMVFEKYVIGADDCLFITDTLGDMRETEKMNVGAIAVTWGFHTPETLSKGNPFRLAQKPEDLPVTVDEYFSR